MIIDNLALQIKHNFRGQSEQRKIYFPLQTIDDVTYCLHSNRPLLTKHCIHHVPPGKKTRSHGKIAYTL